MHSFAPRIRRALIAVVVVAALLALWQLLAAGGPANAPVPAPLAIVAQVQHDGLDFYLRALGATGASAAAGWFWGNLIAVVAALVIGAVGAVRGPVMQVALALYCLPIVAVGPILQIVFGGTTPQIVLAALSVAFPTLVAVDASMRAVGGSLAKLVPAFGGSRLADVVKVRWRSGMPGLFAGLRIAAPSAFLGALIGEYLGADSGIGVAMVSAQQSLQIERTWALAIVSTLAAGAAYLVTGLVARLATGWARDVEATAPAAAPATGARGALTGIASVVGSLVVLLVVWQGFLWVFRIDPFIGYGPVAVFDHLVRDEDAAAHRTVLWEASIPTLAHAGVGLVAGSAAAVLAAAAFVLAPPVRALLFPVAMALRSVPLVALAPLIALVFGRGLTGVAVVTGIVTFFPTLTLLTTALDETPSSVLRLGQAYGAGRVRVLVKLRALGALPSLFTALRTAAPLAITGALLSEWLFTGDGLGHLMLVSQTAFRIGELWSAVALVTAYSLLLFGAIGVVEQLVRRLLDGTLVRRAATGRPRLRTIAIAEGRAA